MTDHQDESQELAIQIIDALTPVLDGKKTLNVMEALGASLLDMFVRVSQFNKDEFKTNTNYFIITMTNATNILCEKWEEKDQYYNGEGRND